MSHIAAPAKVGSTPAFHALRQCGEEEISAPVKNTTAVTVLPAAAAPAVSKVFMQYVGTWSGVKNALIKPIYTVADWVFTFFPHMKEARQLATLGKNTKNLGAIGELPKSAVEVAQAMSGLAEKQDMGAFGNLMNRIGLLIMPAIDVLKVVSDAVRPMCAATARTVNTVFSTATVGTTAYGTVEELGKISKHEEAIASKEAAKTPEDKSLKDRVVDARQASITQSWLKIGMFAHYFAIGALGLATAFCGATVPAFVILALATGGLVCTLLSHFHNKLEVEPTAPVLASASVVRV